MMDCTAVHQINILPILQVPQQLDDSEASSLKRFIGDTMMAMMKEITTWRTGVMLFGKNAGNVGRPVPRTST
jgi:hypothetical protein